MTEPKLGVVIGSTRPCRLGGPIGEWVYERALAHGAFDPELIDLAAVNLPLLDEPHHPRLRHYTQPHTFQWSARIDALDAFVFVTPEYNHGFSAPLKNALDFLYHEWNYKPAGLVGYGGASGGTRAVQMLKPVLTALKMVPILEGVSIAFAKGVVEAGGAVRATEAMHRSTDNMLDELQRWVHAAAELRSKA